MATEDNRAPVATDAGAHARPRRKPVLERGRARTLAALMVLLFSAAIIGIAGGCATPHQSTIRIGPLPRAELAFGAADSEVPAGTTPALVYLSGTPTSKSTAPDYGYAVVMDEKAYRYHDVLLGKRLDTMKVSVDGNPYLIDVLPRIDSEGNLWLPREDHIRLTLHDGDNPAPGTAWRKVAHPTEEQAASAAKRLRTAVDGAMGGCDRDAYGIRSLTKRNIDALMKRAVLPAGRQ